MTDRIWPERADGGQCPVKKLSDRFWEECTAPLQRERTYAAVSLLAVQLCICDANELPLKRIAIRAFDVQLLPPV